MNDGALSSLRPGVQLGNLEYRIDDADLSAYRALAGQGGHYPNLLNDDCRSLLSPHCGPTPLTAVWRRWEFLRPPIPGRRLQVGGWLRAVERRGASVYYRVAAFAVDEIGTEILRAEAVFRQGAAPVAADADAVRLARPSGYAVQSGLILPGDAAALPSLTLPNDANCPQDWTTVIAGWLEGEMGRRFGDDFRWGGRLTLAYRGSMAPGEVIAGDAVTLAADSIHGGATRYRIALSAVNQAGLAVAVGDAEVTAPSPRRV